MSIRTGSVRWRSVSFVPVMVGFCVPVQINATGSADAAVVATIVAAQDGACH
jgi:hypothetical protein